MQEELVRMVAQKTGLPEEKARTATETVIGYLKERLPASVGSQLENVGGAGGGVGDMARGLGGKFTGRE
jgi:nucleoid DNA-binding protein